MAIEITTWTELAAISTALGGDYILMNNLDSTSPGYDIYAGPSANGGAGWSPLGNGTTNWFFGKFDGQGHEIKDLHINRTTGYIGLFGYSSGSCIIKNTKIIDCTISGIQYVGALAGTISVSNTTIIENCSSTGSVSSTKGIVGGLIGETSGSKITIQNCYSHAAVTGTDSTGGFIGYARGVSSYCKTSYSTGAVTGTTYTGGFIGYRSNLTVSDCFWDTQTSGKTTSAGATGKTTAQMQDISTFSAWDISAVANTDTRDTTHIWNIVDDASYPFLSSEYVFVDPGHTGDVTGEIVKSVTSNIFGNIIKPIM